MEEGGGDGHSVQESSLILQLLPCRVAGKIEASWELQSPW